MPISKKIIFGFTGLMASGKGASAKYLTKKYSASAYRFSTMLYDVLKRFYLPATRDNLIKISEIIRGTFGEEIMAQTMAKDIEHDPNQLMVVEGVRRLTDIEYLKKQPGFVLIEIFAEANIRYHRLVRRGEKSDDKAKTFTEFLADHERSTEVSAAAVAAYAKERIDNNGTLAQLYGQLDKLVEKYLKNDP